jgi:hypothetical protein
VASSQEKYAPHRSEGPLLEPSFYGRRDRVTAHKAHARRKKRFGVLYDKVCSLEVLWVAWEQMRHNRCAPGIDGETGPGTSAKAIPSGQGTTPANVIDSLTMLAASTGRKTLTADYYAGCPVRSTSTKFPTRKSRTPPSPPISRKESASASGPLSRRSSKSLAKTCRSGSHSLLHLALELSSGTLVSRRKNKCGNNDPLAVEHAL